MDEEFGVGNLIHEESDRRKQKVLTNQWIEKKKSLFSLFQRYAPKDLTGLRIEHSVEEFKEGQAVILTLKDRSTSIIFSEHIKFYFLIRNSARWKRWWWRWRCFN